MNFREFINTSTGGRLSDRPDFYTGRGPTSSDLNSNILEMIFIGVKTCFGDQAAEKYVDMVEDQEDMSATAFLVNFRYLFEHKFERRRKEEKKDRYSIDTHQAAIHAIFGAFSNKRSEDDDKRMSLGIKRDFLHKHKRKIKPMMYNDYITGW